MKQATILVNGEFPIHSLPLKKLQTSDFLICCDGAINNLEEHKIIPDLIIGDMDSANLKLKEKYKSRICQISEQESNDLTKAINWAIKNEFDSVRIVGAGGLREDHSMANSFLLFSYFNRIDAKMYTNFGIFSCMNGKESFTSYKGQQVSIFSPYGAIIQSYHLRYPINKIALDHLWSGTLNESNGEIFTIESSRPILIFRLYK